MTSYAGLSRHASLLLALIGVTTAGCDHFYSVSGRVRSCADEQPISGAEVSVTLAGEGAPKVELTAADGSFGTAFNAPHGDQPASVTVTKAGFAKATQQAHSEQPVNVCLPPEVVAQK